MSNNILVSFRDEVLFKGPESTLPCNLDERWLDMLSVHMEQFFECNVDDALSLPLAAVVHILFAKSGGEPVTKSQDELIEQLCKYRFELGFEEIRRKTNLSIEPASLETILTDRDVSFCLR